MKKIILLIMVCVITSYGAKFIDNPEPYQFQVDYEKMKQGKAIYETLEHIEQCLGGNVESCEKATTNNNINCKNYMKVIKKGCALGSGLCCARLGDEYHPIARGGASIYGRDCSLRYQDETYKYYRKACELGESEGCRKYRELEHFIYEIDTRERDKTQKSDITIRRK